MGRRLTKKEREYIEAHQLSFTFEAFLDSLPDVVWDLKDMSILKCCLLERSLEIIRNKKAGTASFIEEMAWLFASDKEARNHPFSAENCAATAGIDLEELRQGLDFALDSEKRRHMRLLDNGRYDGQFNYESARWERVRRIERPMYAA